MEFQILGTLRVSHGGAPLAIGGPRHRRLLAALLLNADTVVPTGRLTTALWGDEPPKSAPSMLYVRVCELRAALRAGREVPDAGLLHRDGGYVLRLHDDALDAREFERLAAAGARSLADGDNATARARLAEALDLWRGPAIAEFADEPFARAEAARLEELRLRVVEQRLDADLAAGAHDDVIAELEGLVVAHPLRERFWSRLMLALYRAGRPAEATAAYQSARRRLADELGLDPGRDLTELHAAILRGDPGLDPRPRGNLPAPLTRFVGRRAEIGDIASAVGAHRLVTLTGVGGAGKSRLALEVAATRGADFPDGVWLVDLAALGPTGPVARAVADTLGLREHPHRTVLDTLTDRLRAARALLILDNCEHVVAEVADVAQHLLRAGPDLRVLATSRERLGITGEVLRPVAGLALPPAAADADTAARADSVRLLVERAASVHSGFTLDDATAGPVAQVCRRLDGLPLAIELAAAAVPAYGIEEIAARLDDRFRLLTHGSRTAPPRHQTLRAVVEWSYGRLDDDERRLFERLSVFVGGFTLEAAETVCGRRRPDGPGAGASATNDGDGAEGRPVADLVARLVEVSLVATDGRARAHRYRMLETLRAYGRERLAESGDTARLGDRHATYVLRLVESARRALHGAGPADWLERLEADLGNIRAALEWSIGRADAATAVRLAGSLYPLWDQRGHHREGRRWLARSLDLDAPVPPVVRARALTSVAGLAVIQGDLPAAAAAAGEASELAETAGDPGTGAHALHVLGLTAIYAGENERAVRALSESLRRARQAGDRWLEAFTLLFLAIVALSDEDHERAERLCVECEAALGPIGDREGAAWVAVVRASSAWRQDDRDRAGSYLAASVRGFRALGHQWGLSVGIFLAAQLAAAEGRPEAATALLAKSEAMRRSVGAALLPFMRPWRDEVRDGARALLGEDGFSAAWRAGAEMATAAALAQAARE